MNRSSPFRWLPAFQWLAGACDFSTGILLMLAPDWTLALMGIRHPPEPIGYAAFIGAFVTSVGAAYLYGATLPMNSTNAPRWQTIWLLTALSRSLVALLLGWQVFSGKLETAWLTVVAMDGLLAALQWTGLSRGWLRFKN